jgi:hypothetical protein
VSRDWQDKDEKMRRYFPDIPTSKMSHLIEEWIPHERDRKIMKRRMIDGICFEPLAEEFDLSVRRVKAIVYKWTDVIYRHTA